LPRADPLRRGKPYIYRLMLGVRRPKANVLGAEVAGIVETVGEGVRNQNPGTRVHGDISACGMGGFAEYVA
jgi:NADPH:quinone reductase-like Zn-dependent oxidoreductase